MHTPVDFYKFCNEYAVYHACSSCSSLLSQRAVLCRSTQSGCCTFPVLHKFHVRFVDGQSRHMQVHIQWVVQSPIWNTMFLGLYLSRPMSLHASTHTLLFNAPPFSTCFYSSSPWPPFAGRHTAALATTTFIAQVFLWAFFSVQYVPSWTILKKFTSLFLCLKCGLTTDEYSLV